jgi:type IV pilus assembly protein PilM
VARSLNKIRPSSPLSGRPAAAIEISSEGVLAAAHPARSGRRGAISGADPTIYAFAPLPAGAVVAGLEEANLRTPEVVVDRIREALEKASPRTRAVTLVLPDPVVRVFVLDFDSLPAKADEAMSVIRFRLRKMIPFDVERAGLSHQPLSQGRSEWKVLTAVTPGPILAEYEAAVRSAGYEPGAVLSSSLAALETADPMEAVLGANLSPQSMTTVIANGQDLLLYRSLDLPAEPAERMAEVQRGIAVAAAYYEDKLGAAPNKLYYSGHHELSEFAGWIAEPGLTVVEWVRRPESGMLTGLGGQSIAGVAGALAGAS